MASRSSRSAAHWLKVALVAGAVVLGWEKFGKGKVKI
jgi:hypothetical protein